MSKPSLRPLSAQELQEHLQTDASERLFWRGKALRTTSWTRTETIAAIAVGVALLGVAAQLLAAGPGERSAPASVADQGSAP